MLRRFKPIIVHSYTERSSRTSKWQKAKRHRFRLITVSICRIFFPSLVSAVPPSGVCAQASLLTENAGSYCALTVAEPLAIGFRNQMPKAVVSARHPLVSSLGDDVSPYEISHHRFVYGRTFLFNIQSTRAMNSLHFFWDCFARIWPLVLAPRSTLRHDKLRT
ncbi:hypothetical protein BJY00DRAFT_249313 [Aspergillus carlsbadensis]|nr:hypothetical protein BJY00DRAFT_249313 [Aspergillus carlsbadensis]